MIQVLVKSSSVAIFLTATAIAIPRVAQPVYQAFISISPTVNANLVAKDFKIVQPASQPLSARPAQNHTYKLAQQKLVSAILPSSLVPSSCQMEIALAL